MFQQAVDRSQARPFNAKIAAAEIVQIPTPLQTISPSVLNRQSLQSNSLKRKASTMASSYPSVGATPRLKAHSSKTSVIDSLHANITFNEHDFAFDDDINLDDDSPVQNKTSNKISSVNKPISSLSRLHPALGSSSTAPTQSIASSAPIAWSSSPAAQIPSTTAQPVIAVEITSSQTSTQRRHLPWKKGVVANGIERQASGKSLDISKSNKVHSHSASVHEIATPKPKGADANLPWNITMSALKTEQLKQRRGQRSMETTQADHSIKKKSSKKSRAKAVARIFLSEEQKRIVDMVSKQGSSVFFTGSAGTGKSVLLREIIKELQQKYYAQSDRLAVTASTGLAACNIGGVTLHSFAGIGLGKEPVAELVKKVKKNMKAKQRWQRTKVLIIDEISMVDGDLFDKLEALARAIRGSGKPFGGIQLVITGDFFQLPPVPENGRLAKFAFEAETWNTSIHHTIGLTQIFRQKDPVFAGMLNEMRIGRLSPKSIAAFKALDRVQDLDDSIDATELFPTRAEVEHANRTKMSKLDGKEEVFTSLDGGSLKEAAHRDRLLQNCLAAKEIKLKKGCQVMMIKNINDRIVNGTIGKVEGFMDEKTFNAFQQRESEQYVYEVGDVSQGQSSQMAHPTQSISPRQLRAELLAKFSLENVATTAPRWPVVEFRTMDTGHATYYLCQPETWKIELPNGEVQASRSQIPLILSWALSIHKAQGQTLERVTVDLGRAFEKGQAYVALSRATNQQGLRVLRFDPSKVKAHDRVRDFYDSLYSVQQAPSKQDEEESSLLMNVMSSGDENEAFY